MFWPTSIAVIGASADLGSYGGRTLDILTAQGYRGRLFPVNPRHERIAGLAAVRSVSAIGEPVDLAVVLVPGPAVPGIVGECAAAGVGAAAIFSSGFAETGPDGAVRQREVLAVAREAGMRVLGPNCLGFFNVHGAVAATFSPAADQRRGGARPRPGNVAVISQSGALGFGLFHSGTAAGVGFSHVISCGNAADIDVVEALEFAVDDPRTEVVLAILEGVRDGDRFRAMAARAASRGVKLVVSKLGRSAAGSRAAASHTAALAGSGAAFDAVFERHGVLRAADLEELIDTGMAVARCRPAAGGRVGIVSTSGGAGVWLADACDDLGLELPALNGTPNPIDLTGHVISNANVAATLRAFVSDPGLDAVVLSTSLSDPFILDREADAVEELIREAAKPIVVFTYTIPGQASIDLLARLRLPWATSPGRVARMIKQLTRRGPAPPPPATGRPAGPGPAAFAAPGRDLLTEPEAKRWLTAWGITTPDGSVATSARDATAIAARLGSPVAMKVVSPDIIHKADAGGVLLGVEPAGAGGAFLQLTEGARQRHAAVDGVLVERMAEPGYEVIVGVLHDQTFGRLVLVGSGGVDTELIADVRLLPLPVDTAHAARAIGQLRCAPALRGARGRVPADIDALAHLVVQVAAMAASSPAMQLDLNPVLVHPVGRGVTVVDAWADLRPALPPRRTHGLQPLQAPAHHQGGRRRHCRAGPSRSEERHQRRAASRAGYRLHRPRHGRRL
jgi:acyl-CoA synthetase (NDP forming)